MDKQKELNRRIIQADTMTPRSPKPASNLAARIAKPATILKTTLSQSDIDLLDGQMAGKSDEAREQILKIWYNWTDEVAAIVAQNNNGHLAGNVWESAKRAEANHKRNLLVVKASQQITIYEQVVAAVDKMDYSPVKIILWESDTSNNEIYLIPDGLGSLFLVYLKNGKQVVERVAYVPGYALEHNVWHLDFSKIRYDDWVERCKNAQPVVRSALSNLPETRLAGRSPEAQKAMRG